MSWMDALNVNQEEPLEDNIVDKFLNRKIVLTLLEEENEIVIEKLNK